MSRFDVGWAHTGRRRRRCGRRWRLERALESATSRASATTAQPACHALLDAMLALTLVTRDHERGLRYAATAAVIGHRAARDTAPSAAQTLLPAAADVYHKIGLVLLRIAHTLPDDALRQLTAHAQRYATATATATAVGAVRAAGHDQKRDDAGADGRDTVALRQIYALRLLDVVALLRGAVAAYDHGPVPLGPCASDVGAYVFWLVTGTTATGHDLERLCGNAQNVEAAHVAAILQHYAGPPDDVRRYSGAAADDAKSAPATPPPPRGGLSATGVGLLQRGAAVAMKMGGLEKSFAWHVLAVTQPHAPPPCDDAGYEPLARVAWLLSWQPHRCRQLVQCVRDVSELAGDAHAPHPSPHIVARCVLQERVLAFAMAQARRRRRGHPHAAVPATAATADPAADSTHMTDAVLRAWRRAIRRLFDPTLPGGARGAILPPAPRDTFPCAAVAIRRALLHQTLSRKQVSACYVLAQKPLCDPDAAESAFEYQFAGLVNDLRRGNSNTDLWRCQMAAFARILMTLWNDAHALEQFAACVAAEEEEDDDGDDDLTAAADDASNDMACATVRACVARVHALLLLHTAMQARAHAAQVKPPMSAGHIPDRVQRERELAAAVFEQLHACTERAARHFDALRIVLGLTARSTVTPAAGPPAPPLLAAATAATAAAAGAGAATACAATTTAATAGADPTPAASSPSDTAASVFGPSTVAVVTAAANANPKTQKRKEHRARQALKAQAEAAAAEERAAAEAAAAAKRAAEEAAAAAERGAAEAATKEAERLREENDRIERARRAADLQRVRELESAISTAQQQLQETEDDIEDMEKALKRRLRPGAVNAIVPGTAEETKARGRIEQHHLRAAALRREHEQCCDELTALRLHLHSDGTDGRSADGKGAGGGADATVSAAPAADQSYLRVRALVATGLVRPRTLRRDYALLPSAESAALGVHSARYPLFVATLRGVKPDASKGQAAAQQRVVIKEFALDAFSAVQRELRLFRDRPHPNLLPVEAVFFDADVLSPTAGAAGVSGQQQVMPAIDAATKVYLQMPYCEGGNLRLWLSRHLSAFERQFKAGTADAKAAVPAGSQSQTAGSALDALTDGVRRVLYGALQGVAYLHALEVVHRDIKPENVVLTAAALHATARLCDFELIKDLNSPLETQSVHTATPVGLTPAYAAPEVLQSAAAGAAAVSKAVDMYSFGCILRECVELIRAAVKAAGVADESAGADTAAPAAPVWDGFRLCAAQLVPRLLDADPQRRPSAAELLAHELFVPPVRAPTTPAPNPMAATLMLPRHWTLAVKSHTAVSTSDAVQIVPLPSSSGEYQRVLKHWLLSAPKRAFVTRIERVENAGVWQWFALAHAKARERYIAAAAAAAAAAVSAASGGDAKRQPKRQPERQPEGQPERQSVAVPADPTGSVAPEGWEWERWLWHGTTAAAVSAIAGGGNGFDMRLCGANGVKYGNGNYFALNAAYSHEYAVPHPTEAHHPRRMFLARVLTGRFTAGAEGIKTPPPLPPLPQPLPPPPPLPAAAAAARPVGAAAAAAAAAGAAAGAGASATALGEYESVVNDCANPTIWVTFHNAHAYPTHIITYRQTN